MKKLVLIGNGLAHAQVLRGYALAPPVNAAVTLVGSTQPVVHTDMLPGLLAGHYTHAQCHIELRRLADRARIEVSEDDAVALDTVRRRVVTRSGRELEYDFVSLDVEPAMPTSEVPGLREFGLVARPSEILLQGWERIIELAREGKLAKLTMVGGEAAAVELLLAMEFRLRRELTREQFAACGFSIVTEAARLMASYPEALATAVERICAERGISILRGAPAIALEQDCVRLGNGARLKTDVTVWATGARAPRWLTASGLAVDARGLLTTDERLRSTADKRIFAAGDCASCVVHPHLRSSGEALQQGRALFAALLRALAGEVPEAWTPPATPTILLGLGGREAIAARGEQAHLGLRWLQWLWRDRIDRRALRPYRN
ncbi:MAG: FAD-dependent oxidoreductase [Burkholderiales bacterium]